MAYARTRRISFGYAAIIGSRSRWSSLTAGVVKIRVCATWTWTCGCQQRAPHSIVMSSSTGAWLHSRKFPRHGKLILGTFLYKLRLTFSSSSQTTKRQMLVTWMTSRSVKKRRSYPKTCQAISAELPFTKWGRLDIHQNRRCELIVDNSELAYLWLRSKFSLKIFDILHNAYTTAIWSKSWIVMASHFLNHISKPNLVSYTQNMSKNIF